MSYVRNTGIVTSGSVMVFAVLSTGTAFGQAATVPPKPASVTSPNGLANALRSTLQSTVLIDQPDGTAEGGPIWARGMTFKARFDSDGFTYIPFLGSNAPRSYPVQFTIADVKIGGASVRLNDHVAPSVNGTHITYDRGGLREIYELKPASIEQTFEIDPELRRSAGAVVIRLAATTDLAASDQTGGIAFTTDLGRVHYGQAAAIDRRGAKVNIPTILTTAGDIEITVPSNFPADRTQPLIIDPVITTVAVENGGFGTREADVAYDLPYHNYAVCFEQFFGAADSDVYCALFTEAGALIPGSLVQIDFTSDAWKKPRIANLRVGDQFLVVAEVGVAPTRIIRGRTRLAADNTTGAQFTINEIASSGDKHNPDVGGNPAGSGGDPTAWMVVWERDFSGTDHDIHGRAVNSAGAPSTTTLLFDNSGEFDSNPQISNSNDLFLWMIAWQRNVGASHDIRGATVYDNGSFQTFPIDTSSDDDTLPSVSSRTNPGAWFMVVYQENGGDLYARIMADGGGILAGANLTVLAGLSGRIQLRPNVDTDGTKFIVSYAEQYGSNPNDHDIYAQSICRNGSSLKLAEGRKTLAYNGTDEWGPHIASIYTSHTIDRNAMIVWHDAGPAGYGDCSGVTWITPIACCPPDVAPDGGNGVVDIDDLVRVITQWTTFCLTCPGDVNGDQAVNIDDLVAVITGWGGCP